MGICISIKVKNCTTPIQVTVSQVCSIGGANVNFKAIVNRIGEQLKVITERIHSPLSVNVSVVCSLSDFYYMDVSPGDIQWITSDDVIMYTVTSNVDWEIQ